MFVNAKGKQQRQVVRLQCQEQCIDDIPCYLLGSTRVHFLQQPFSQ